MKTSTSTLNPFAVAYVPVAKGQVQDADKECKTMSAAIVNDPKLNVHQTDDSLCTSAEIPQEIGFNFSDVESEMDLAYLQMTFPGISVQFLNDVYNINGGDLESAIDMLSELEVYISYICLISTFKSQFTGITICYIINIICNFIL
ncbi:hypothetical protein RND81_08G080800 [Saponaria officinalis]|uniref:CUE domain-containing protein n=1 Tax=Saponaria officinalis TaxID=3572 RepID=A0AAW1J6F9_SAPOF